MNNARVCLVFLLIATSVTKSMDRIREEKRVVAYQIKPYPHIGDVIEFFGPRHTLGLFRYDSVQRKCAIGSKWYALDELIGPQNFPFDLSMAKDYTDVVIEIPEETSENLEGQDCFIQ